MAHIVAGNQKIEITEDEYRRWHNRASRGGDPSMLALKSGIIVFKSNIDAIIPTEEPYKVDTEIVVPAEPEPEPEPIPEPEEPKTDMITKKELKTILDNSGLSQQAFAASLGYSVATLRMALKEGKITHPFSDAVKKKYGV